MVIGGYTVMSTDILVLTLCVGYLIRRFRRDV
jgi:hypothetical protein